MYALFNVCQNCYLSYHQVQNHIWYPCYDGRIKFFRTTKQADEFLDTIVYGNGADLDNMNHVIPNARERIEDYQIHEFGVLRRVQLKDKYKTNA